MANFSDEFIFVSCGLTAAVKTNTEDDQQLLSSEVDIYDINKHQWIQGTNLNIARIYHSSCCLGDFVYSFGGCDSEGTFLNNFERLNARKALENSKIHNIDRSYNWELAEMGCETFEARANCIASPINDREIILFGGVNA